MRDKSKGDNDRCHGRHSNNLSGTKPVPHPLEMSAFLPNFS